jgi:hypothetical protein
VDDADAATTQFADGLVAVRKLERWNGGRNLDAGAVPRGTGILVGADQREHQVQENGIVAAGILHEYRPLFRRHVASAGEDRARATETVGP